jgi:hypothetical protein
LRLTASTESALFSVCSLLKPRVMWEIIIISPWLWRKSVRPCRQKISWCEFLIKNIVFFQTSALPRRNCFIPQFIILRVFEFCISNWSASRIFNCYITNVNNSRALDFCIHRPNLGLRGGKRQPPIFSYLRIVFLFVTTIIWVVYSWRTASVV